MSERGICPDSAQCNMKQDAERAIADTNINPDNFRGIPLPERARKDMAAPENNSMKIKVVNGTLLYICSHPAFSLSSAIAVLAADMVPGMASRGNNESLRNSERHLHRRERSTHNPETANIKKPV